jgi:hypothetical protein
LSADDRVFMGPSFTMNAEVGSAALSDRTTRFARA